MKTPPHTGGVMHRAIDLSQFDHMNHNHNRIKEAQIGISVLQRLFLAQLDFTNMSIINRLPDLTLQGKGKHAHHRIPECPVHEIEPEEIKTIRI